MMKTNSYGSAHHCALGINADIHINASLIRKPSASCLPTKLRLSLEDGGRMRCKDCSI
jgi:hypothetical protein